MLDARRALVAALALLTTGYVVYWVRSVRRRGQGSESSRPTPPQLAIGAVEPERQPRGHGAKLCYRAV